MSIASRIVIQSTVTLLIVGLLTLLGIVGTTIWLGERAQVYFKEVIDARDTRSSAVELRNALQTAESSQRGFLFTGNEIYLAPYGTAKGSAQRQLASLVRTLAPFANADVMLKRLESILADKFQEMDETIALKSERKDAGALAVVQTNRGKALMDEANVFLSGIIRAADERLTTGVDEQRANATMLRWVSVIGGLVIVLVVGGASLTVHRYTQEALQTRDHVSSLNANLEHRVAERTAELARANDEVQRFAYMLTHDLRAPLVNIMGFTSELESSVKSLQSLAERAGAATDPISDQARIAVTTDMPEAINFIRSSTTKMDSLINAILRLSREGKRQIRPEEIDLSALIKASVGAIQHQLSAAGGKINLSLDVPVIVTDKLALEQVVGNLLDNAVKFRVLNRPLWIEVRTRLDPHNCVCIEVVDNGRGIAERDIERVFELFRRSGTQDQPGEGIGLAHVRTLVRNLGGDITLSSVLGQGTTFRVVLPSDLISFGSSIA